MPGSDRFVLGQGGAILWLLEVSLSRLVLPVWPLSIIHRQISPRQALLQNTHSYLKTLSSSLPMAWSGPSVHAVCDGVVDIFTP